MKAKYVCQLRSTLVYFYIYYTVLNFLNDITDPDGVVHPIKHCPVKAVTVVLIPSTQPILKVT